MLWHLGHSYLPPTLPLPDIRTHQKANIEIPPLDMDFDADPQLHGSLSRAHLERGWDSGKGRL